MTTQKVFEFTSECFKKLLDRFVGSLTSGEENDGF